MDGVIKTVEKCAVLVTDVKYRMALSAIRDLGQAGFFVAAAHMDDGSAPLGFSSKYVSHRVLLPAGDETRYAQALADACRNLSQARGEPLVLFPVGAFTIRAIAAHRPLFEGAAVFLLPDAQTLVQANDKDYVTNLAAQLGIPVPRSFGRDISEIIKNAAYPAVIKYRNGEALGLQARERYCVVKNQTELEAQYARMSSLQSAPLVQEYIPGGGFGVSCVMDRDSRPVSILCHRRIREFPISGGPSACCESAWDDTLVSHAVKLLSALRFQGIAMVEFRGQADKFALMEINPRIWGSFPLTRAVKSGFSESYCRAAAGQTLEVCTSPDYPVGRRMNFLLQDGACALTLIKSGRLKRGAGAIWDILDPRVRDGVLEWGDLKASGAYLKNALHKAR